jgi:hypothetical protein
MLMDNSTFPDTCRDSYEDMLDKNLDLIENFPPFGTFCSENEDLDTLLNNAPRCTGRNGA